MDSQQHQLVQLDINLIQFNPLQPRGVIAPESLSDLVESIREQGILEPLVVADTPAGYQLIAGERRLRAAKIVGLTTVPVIVRNTSPREMLEMSIVENVQREDLNPIERGLAYKRLIDEFGLEMSAVAKRVGKSVPTVSNTIRLLTLPDAIQDALIAGVISEGHVRTLISLGDTNLMLTLFKQILKNNSTVREAEDMAREARAKTQPKAAKNKSVNKLYIPELDELAARIKSRFAFAQSEDKTDRKDLKVKINQSERAVKVYIQIDGKFEETTEKLKEMVKNLLGEEVN